MGIWREPSLIGSYVKNQQDILDGKTRGNTFKPLQGIQNDPCWLVSTSTTSYRVPLSLPSYTWPNNKWALPPSLQSCFHWLVGIKVEFNNPALCLVVRMSICLRWWRLSVLLYRRLKTAAQANKKVWTNSLLKIKLKRGCILIWIVSHFHPKMRNWLNTKASSKISPPIYQL